MKIIKEEMVTGITLSIYEIGMFKHLLNYAYHRLSKHKGSGLEGFVSLDEVNKLRKQLGIKL